MLPSLDHDRQNLEMLCDEPGVLALLLAVQRVFAPQEVGRALVLVRRQEFPRCAGALEGKQDVGVAPQVPVDVVFERRHGGFSDAALAILPDLRAALNNKTRHSTQKLNG